MDPTTTVEQTLPVNQEQNEEAVQASAFLHGGHEVQNSPENVGHGVENEPMDGDDWFDAIASSEHGREGPFSPGSAAQASPPSYASFARSMDRYALAGANSNLGGRNESEQGYGSQPRQQYTQGTAQMLQSQQPVDPLFSPLREANILDRSTWGRPLNIPDEKEDTPPRPQLPLSYFGEPLPTFSNRPPVQSNWSQTGMPGSSQGQFEVGSNDRGFRAGLELYQPSFLLASQEQIRRDLELATAPGPEAQANVGHQSSSNDQRTQDTVRPAASFGRWSGRITSSDAARGHLYSVRWAVQTPPAQDPTYPTNDEGWELAAAVLYDAFVDESQFKDSEKGDAVKYLRGGRWSQDDVEANIWLIVDAMRRLHEQGCTTPSYYFIAKIRNTEYNSDTHDLSDARSLLFGERLQKIADLLRVSKNKCANLMLAKETEQIVTDPSTFAGRQIDVSGRVQAKSKQEQGQKQQTKKPRERSVQEETTSPGTQDAFAHTELGSGVRPRRHTTSAEPPHNSTDFFTYGSSIGNPNRPVHQQRVGSQVDGQFHRTGSLDDAQFADIMLAHSPDNNAPDAHNEQLGNDGLGLSGEDRSEEEIDEDRFI